LVDYRSWEPWYEAIRRAFGYSLSLEEDERAARILDSLLSGFNIQEALRRAEELLRGRTVLAFGAGPNLEGHLRLVKEALKGLDRTNITLVSADGATAALLEAGLRPDIITTDLDGDVNAILEANRAGSLVVVHAHGDNIGALLRHVRAFRNGLLLGTCQTRPVGRVFNFGGFTDGDRAVFMALHFGARRVLLAGWYFGGLIGRFSKPRLRGHVRAGEVKGMKLDFARKLLSWLASLHPGRVFVLEEVVPNAETIGPGELASFLRGGGS